MSVIDKAKIIYDIVQIQQLNDRMVLALKLSKKLKYSDDREDALPDIDCELNLQQFSTLWGTVITAQDAGKTLWDVNKVAILNACIELDIINGEMA
jgi:hypothetical protein